MLDRRRHNIYGNAKELIGPSDFYDANRKPSALIKAGYDQQQSRLHRLRKEKGKERKGDATHFSQNGELRFRYPAGSFTA